MPGGGAFGGEVPGGEVPGGAVPGGAVPGGAVPGGEMPDAEVPGGGAPGGAAPGGGGPDGEVPGDIVEAVVKVLAAWDWAARPAGVITLPSRSRPRLVASLGRQIAGIGRMPYLGALSYAGGTPPGRPAAQHNSAQRLRALWHELTVPGPVRDAVAALDGPVLLADDRIDTGWTMTVGAMLLREAGASAVLPLALAASTG